MLGWITTKICKNKLAEKKAEINSLAHEVENERNRLESKFSAIVAEKRNDYENRLRSYQDNAKFDEQMLIEVRNTCTEAATRYAEMFEKLLEYLELRLPLEIFIKENDLRYDIEKYLSLKKKLVDTEIHILRDKSNIRVRMILLSQLNPAFQCVKTETQERYQKIIGGRIDLLKSREDLLSKSERSSLLNLLSWFDEAKEVQNQILELNQFKKFLNNEIKDNRLFITKNKKELLVCKQVLTEKEAIASESYQNYMEYYQSLLKPEEFKNFNEKNRNITEQQQQLKTSFQEVKDKFARAKNYVVHIHNIGDYVNLAVAKFERGIAAEEQQRVYLQNQKDNERLSNEYIANNRQLTKLKLIRDGIVSYKPIHIEKLFKLLSSNNQKSIGTSGIL